MENIVINIDDMVSELKLLVDDLKSRLEDQPVSKRVIDGFLLFYENVRLYNEMSQGDDVNKITSSAQTIAVYAQSIGHGVSKLENSNDYVKDLGNKAVELSNKLANFIENTPHEYLTLKTEKALNEDVAVNSFKLVKSNLRKISDSHLEHDQRIKKLLGENDARIGELGEKINKINSTLKSEIEKVAILYGKSLEEIESKKNQINEILGHVSGRAISGDYETSASEEKRMADLLRYASLGCMFTIVIIVAYSFWNTTKAEFQWENSIFRIVLAVMLSVPAAYLARESAKHREQQYSHLQTSLDLKAISPYISSLPEAEQHKIKIEVAARLFAAKDFSRVGADPYPINVHELVMELIKKLEINRGSSSKNKDG